MFKLNTNKTDADKTRPKIKTRLQQGEHAMKMIQPCQATKERA